MNPTLWIWGRTLIFPVLKFEHIVFILFQCTQVCGIGSNNCSIPESIGPSQGIGKCARPRWWPLSQSAGVCWPSPDHLLEFGELTGFGYWFFKEFKVFKIIFTIQRMLSLKMQLYCQFLLPIRNHILFYNVFYSSLLWCFLMYSSLWHIFCFRFGISDDLMFLVTCQVLFLLQRAWTRMFRQVMWGKLSWIA